MSILITGAGGFVGQELATGLLSSSPDISVTLSDVAAPRIPAGQEARVKSVKADLTSHEVVDSLISENHGFDTIYLLHGIMSSGAEANFELGLKVNFDATRYILDRLRQVSPGVKVIFTSSLAVYGPAPPGFVITETNFPPVPSSSYGSQKLMIETLLTDYSRRGFLDGRCVRLPTVTVRAGKPTQAASSFVSDIIREPFNGNKAFLPVSPKTEVWVCSPYTVIKNLILAGEISKEKFAAGPAGRSVNLPGLKVSVQEMLDALEQIGGKEKRALIEERHDQSVDQIVRTWSPNFDTARAKELGFVGDVGMLENIKQYASRYG